MSPGVVRSPDRKVTLEFERHGDPVQAVARDEGLLSALAQTGDAACVRLWENAPAIVVGRGYYRRLPWSPEWVGGLPVVARTSGGEVVVHGPGILNVSLAIAAPAWAGNIEAAFAAFSGSVSGALRQIGFEVTVGEVEGAYCPGRHDISVAGRKVMGISQRRTRQGILVHGTLNVGVQPAWVGLVLTQFYAAAKLESMPRKDLIGSLAPGDGKVWQRVLDAVGHGLVERAQALLEGAATA